MVRTLKDLRDYKMSPEEREKIAQLHERQKRAPKRKPEPPAEQLAIPSECYVPVETPKKEKR